VVNWRQHHLYLSTKIFKKIACFLREMSADNDFLGVLHSPELDTLVTSVVDTLSLDNADFACNLLAFHMNVCINKYGADRVLSQEYITVVDTCLQKVLGLESGATPGEYFMHHFSS
jgi:hypothetical protein